MNRRTFFAAALGMVGSAALPTPPTGLRLGLTGEILYGLPVPRRVRLRYVPNTSGIDPYPKIVLIWSELPYKRKDAS